MFGALAARGGVVSRVRYEEFVGGPRQVLTDVAAFAGAPVGPDGVAFATDTSVELHQGHTVSGNPVRFRNGVVQLRRDEAWRSNLPAGQRRAVSVLASPLLCCATATRSRRGDPASSAGRRRRRRPRQFAAVIMPAATVRLVASSTSTKPPVERLREYSSTISGTVERSRTRPMSLSDRLWAPSSRCSVLTSSRYCRSRTTVRAVRVVCLIAYFRPTCSEACSSIQQIIASMSWAGRGALCGRQIMSPREMSIWSSRRTVTDIGAYASSTGPSAVSTEAIREVKPLGSTMTSSPGLSTPPATCPA